MLIKVLFHRPYKDHDPTILLKWQLFVFYSFSRIREYPSTRILVFINKINNNVMVVQI